MKKRSILMMLLVASALLCSATSHADDDRKQKIEIAVEANLDQRNYVIDATMAHPPSGRSVPMNSNYNVHINGDSLRCYLPYFGRAYRVPYGGGEGLIFNTEIHNYKSVEGKRKVTKVTFDARTTEDSYKFAIDIFPNGLSSINVQPSNKQSISFTGTMRTGDPKTTK